MSRREEAPHSARGDADSISTGPAIVGIAGSFVVLIVGLVYGLILSSHQPPGVVQLEAEAPHAEMPAHVSIKPSEFRYAQNVAPSPPALDHQPLPATRPASATAKSLAGAIGDVAAGYWQQHDSLAAGFAPFEQPARAKVRVPHEETISTDFTHRKPREIKTGDTLTDYLVNRVTELDVLSMNDDFLKAAKAAPTQGHTPHANMLASLTREKPEFAGLPLQMGHDCTTENAVAVQREKLAVGVRAANARSVLDWTGTFYSGEIDILDAEDFVRGFAQYKRLLVKQSQWQSPDQVAVLEQMLQVESPEHRQLLIYLLSEIEGPQASQAIARRAICDLDESVREAALRALESRDAHEYRNVIEYGRDYPWTPVALRAERLIEQTEQTEQGSDAGNPADGRAGRTTAKIDEMVDMVVNGTHVSVPYEAADGQWVVDEMVKVNHLRNCTLCHAVSLDTWHPLRGQIPSPGMPLPVPQKYYSSSHGNFVRADVVYLRQDFSVMLPVEDPGKWPKLQRFDFFVRTRPATPSEMSQRTDNTLGKLVADTVRTFLSCVEAEMVDTLAMLSGREIRTSIKARN